MAIALLRAMRFAGRDRLPAWVVRMRSVLRFMIPAPRPRRPNGSGARAAAPAQDEQYDNTDRVAALMVWMRIVRVDDLVKDRRPPKAAALRAVLDKIIDTNSI